MRGDAGGSSPRCKEVFLRAQQRWLLRIRQGLARNTATYRENYFSISEGNGVSGQISCPGPARLCQTTPLSDMRKPPVSE